MQKFIFEIRSRGFFLLVIAFLIISGLVYAEVTEQFDESSILHFQSVSGNTSLDLSMWVSTEIGGIIPIMLFCFVMFVWRKTRRMGLILLLAILIATVLAGYLKDYVVDRPRPDLEYLGSELPIDVESDTTVLGGQGSFPSGHVARASALAFVLGYALTLCRINRNTHKKVQRTFLMEVLGFFLRKKLFQMALFWLMYVRQRNLPKAVFLKL